MLKKTCLEQKFSLNPAELSSFYFSGNYDILWNHVIFLELIFKCYLTT